MARRWAVAIVDDLFNPHGYAMGLRLKRELGVPIVSYSTCNSLSAGQNDQFALGLRRRMFTDDTRHAAHFQAAIPRFAQICLHTFQPIAMSILLPTHLHIAFGTLRPLFMRFSAFMSKVGGNER